MYKKIIIFSILTVFILSGVFAQEDDAQNHNDQNHEVQKQDENHVWAKNRIALSAGMIGAELSYERLFSRHFSVLGQVSYSNWIFADSISVSGKARLYPFGKTFYLELGLGYSNGYNLGDDLTKFIGDLMLGLITFGLWFTTDQFKENNKELDSSRDHGLLLQTGLGWNIDIGKPDGFMLPIGMGLDIRIAANDILPPILPYLRIGLGYSF